MSVVFAMIASFILSRTLVPTLALYLLKPHVGGALDEEEADHAMHLAQGDHFLARLQRRFESGFEAVAGILSQSSGPGAEPPPHIRVRLHGRGRSSPSCCSLSWARTSSPPSIPGRSPCMCARPSARAWKTPPSRSPTSKPQSAAIIPRREVATIVDSLGIPQSSINLIYNNTGIIGPQDTDIFISLNDGIMPTPDYVKTLREVLPRDFPGTTFSFPPAGHHQPDPEFRHAGAASMCSSPASITRRPRPLPIRSCARSAACRASPIRACSSPTKHPQLNFTVDRVRHGPARPDRKGRHQRAGHVAGRHRSDRAQLLPQSQERCLLRDRGTDAGIQARTRWKRCSTCQ